MSKLDTLSLEVEDFSIDGPSRIVKASFASGGAYVEGGVGTPSVMSTVFGGTAGRYDVAVAYFDESDGESSSSVSVDGHEIAAWKWDADSGGAYANGGSLKEHVIKNVTLEKLSKIEIKGEGDGGEPLRIDAVELRPTVQGAASRQVEGVLAFEGAVGYGAVTEGGRGGAVVRVTNLNDSGEGSLRWALEELDIPRVVIFDVGGTIELRRRIDVNGDVTVAGQTAPGEGITITGARLRVVESDVIVRGLKIRPGDGPGEEPENRDGISVGKSGSVVERVIVDSNSFTWAMDETAATWGAPKDVTYSNNIIAEGLDRTERSEGLNSFGLLIGDDTERASIVGNLFTDNVYRNPQLKPSDDIEIINNVIYNYGINGFSAYNATAHLIGNVWIEGEDTAPNNPVRLLSMDSGTAYYLEDNVRMESASGRASRSDITEGKGTGAIKGRPVFEGSGIEAMASSEVVGHVLGTVGARAGGKLDAIDARIVKEVWGGKGRIIDSPDDVPDHTPPTVRTSLADRDKDGIPDLYEAIIGSNARVADAGGDADGDGYTNIEDYVNGLIDGFGEPAAPTDEKVEPAEEAPEPTPEGPSTDSGASRPTAQPIRLEVEDATRVENMRVQALGAASERAVLQAVDKASKSAVELDFDGRAGLYDVTVNYFDESDGVSRLSLKLNGTKIGSWDWDDRSGGTFADDRSAASRTFEDVAFSGDDVIRLFGWADGGEPLRIDSVDLVHVGGPSSGSPADEPSKPSKPASTPTTLTVEAEDVAARSGMRVQELGAASGGEALRAELGEAGAFGFDFDGPSGLYRIAVDHFDESDGESRMAIEVGGETVDRWVWDADLGHHLAVERTRTTHETGVVEILEGDAIRFRGEADGREPLRVDAVRFEQVGALPQVAPQQAEEWRIEAEEIGDLTNMRVDRNGAASGDELIRVVRSGTGEAEFDFGGRAGRYDIEVAYFDENDGVSSMSLEVDGAVIGSWDWDQKLGHKWATSSTLTSQSFDSVDLREGARVALVGEGDEDEPLRLDAVTFIPDVDLV